MALVGQLSNPCQALKRAFTASEQATVVRRGQRSDASLPSGWKPKPRLRRLSAEEVERVVAGYQAGLSIYQLAREYKIHRETVSKVLERQGVARRYRKLESPEERASVVERYQAGESTATIGKALGVDADTVARMLRTAGVALRPRNGWPPSNRRQE